MSYTPDSIRVGRLSANATGDTKDCDVLTIEYDPKLDMAYFFVTRTFTHQGETLVHLVYGSEMTQPTIEAMYREVKSIIADERFKFKNITRATKSFHWTNAGNGFNKNLIAQAMNKVRP